MKKIYMQPLTEVVKIGTEQMICQSIVTLSGDAGISQGGEVTSGSVNPDAKEDWFYNNDLW